MQTGGRTFARILMRALKILTLLALSNLPVLSGLAGWPWPAWIAPAMSLTALYLLLHILPRREKGALPRLSILIGGYELVLCAAVSFVIECGLFLWLCLGADRGLSMPRLIATGVLALAVHALLLANGFIRIVATSEQLGILWRVLFLLFWWMPVFNLFLFGKVCRTAWKEFRFEMVKLETFLAEKENEICKTRYPILLVHGIFFRDWQMFNYWGRIPRELQRNGAAVFYGRQQSAAPVETSAAELKEQIEQVLQNTHSEKLHIIAHSKGGLDARYAIARLGMAGAVASLTTVNTPHRGCLFVGRLLRIVPDGIVRAVAKRYNAVFRKLGDRDPDFYGGIHALTAESCAAFNREVPDVPGVLYQSVMSRMKKRGSAAFPLNLGYTLIRPLEGDNDGLVGVESAKWGTFLGLVDPQKERGISHGDMIDLTRKIFPDSMWPGFTSGWCGSSKAKGL